MDTLLSPNYVQIQPEANTFRLWLAQCGIIHLRFGGPQKEFTTPGSIVLLASQMFSRTPRGAAGLLSCPSLQQCRENPLFLASRHDVSIRFIGTTDDELRRPQPRSRGPRPRSGPHLKRRPPPKRMESVQLDQKFLGEPGKIVVVADKQRRRRGPSARFEPREKEEQGGIPFMLGELEKQESSVDTQFVNGRIEKFRAPYQPGDILSVTDFEGLRWKIQSAFTGYQLSDYISDYKMEVPGADPSEGEGEIEIGEGGSRDRKVDISEWRPGISPMLELGPRQKPLSSRTAASRSFKAKEILTERILRDCWNIGISGEVGQIDMRLPSSLVSLLLSSQQFSFEELASLHEAKVDVTLKLGLVRITGRKHNCQSIRDIVYDGTKRIREEEHDLYPHAGGKSEAARAFTTEFLDWVGRTYEVAFEAVSLRGPKKILYLAENKRGMEEARRTLNLAVYRASGESIPFSTYLSSSQPANIYGINPENTATWLDRQKPWFRWAMPSTELTTPKSMASPFFDQHRMELSHELLKLLRKPPANAALNKRVDVHENITAAVGRCLFLRKPTMKNTSVEASQLGKMALPRIFTTDVPAADSFLRPLSQVEDNRVQRLYRIQLVPSAIHANVFPQLDLEVAVEEKGDLEMNKEIVVHSAKAVMAESSVDYLLPENGLDLRFTRKMYCDLLQGVWQRSTDTAETLRNCLLNIFTEKRQLGGKDIPLPPFINLSLPKDILLKKTLPSSITTTSTDGEDLATAEYMFLPISDRRGTLLHRYGFRGQKLGYMYYESGPFYPQRTTDMFVDMDFARAYSEPADGKPSSSSSSLSETQEQEFNFFYGSACKLAFDLDSAGRTYIFR